MVQKHILYPEKIFLVKEDRVQDGSIATLAALMADASAYAIPRRGEEGVTFNFSESGVDVRERAPSGVMVHLNNFRTEFGVTFTINLGRWDFNIEALLRGDHPENVKVDYDGSIDAANDATVTGLQFVQTILRDEFTFLFVMPEEPTTGKRLYYYIPRAVRNPGDREQVLNVAQVTSQLSFRALALDDEITPDPRTAHRAIYAGVTHTDLAFAFYGKPDGSV